MPRTSTAPLKVVIGIPTYCRQEILRRALSDLCTKVARPEPGQAVVQIVVADNECAPATSQIVADFPEVRYIDVPERGVDAFTRDALIEEAIRLQADVLVFLDDDDRPQPDWLIELLAAYKPGEVEGVFGSVRNPGGRMRVKKASMGNCLFDVEYLKSIPSPRFDPRLALVGGADRVFFAQIRARGLREVYAERAITDLDAWHPADMEKGRRERPARHFNDGYKRAFIKKIHPTFGPLWPYVGSAFGKAVVKTAMLPIRFRRPRTFDKAIEFWLKFAGAIFAAIGGKFEYYR